MKNIEEEVWINAWTQTFSVVLFENMRGLHESISTQYTHCDVCIGYTHTQSTHQHIFASNFHSTSMIKWIISFHISRVKLLFTSSTSGDNEDVFSSVMLHTDTLALPVIISVFTRHHSPLWKLLFKKPLQTLLANTEMIYMIGTGNSQALIQYVVVRNELSTTHIVTFVKGHNETFRVLNGPIMQHVKGSGLILISNQLLLFAVSICERS